MVCLACLLKKVVLLLLDMPFCASRMDLKNERTVLFVDGVQTSQVAFFQLINQTGLFRDKWYCVKTKTPSERLGANESLSCHMGKRGLLLSLLKAPNSVWEDIYIYIIFT